MARRIYLLAVVVDAHREDDLPELLATSLADALPKEWVSEDDGDPWWVVAMHTAGHLHPDDLEV